MDRILVHAANLTGSGAHAIGLNLVPALLDARPRTHFTLLFPDTQGFRSLRLAKNSDVIFIRYRRGWRNDIYRLNDLLWRTPHLVQKINTRACLFLGDLPPIVLGCPSILFLQQPLLVYDDWELGNSQSWNLFKRSFIKRYFAMTIKRIHRVIAQTPVMAERLKRCYKISPNKIAVIPQPAPQELFLEAEESERSPPIELVEKPIKLLFLASYYRHKNHKIIGPVIRELQKRGMADMVHFFYNRHG